MSCSKVPASLCSMTKIDEIKTSAVLKEKATMVLRTDCSFTMEQLDPSRYETISVCCKHYFAPMITLTRANHDN